MSKQLYEVPAAFAAAARYRKDDYERAYAESISDPEEFWGRMGQRIDWVRPYTRSRTSASTPGTSASAGTRTAS